MLQVLGLMPHSARRKSWNTDTEDKATHFDCDRSGLQFKAPESAPWQCHLHTEEPCSLLSPRIHSKVILCCTNGVWKEVWQQPSCTLTLARLRLLRSNLPSLPLYCPHDARWASLQLCLSFPPFIKRSLHLAEQFKRIQQLRGLSIYMCSRWLSSVWCTISQLCHF